jgi:uncharacterized protein YrrD
VAADLGQPSSYFTLEKGQPVYSCDGKNVGRVERVIADPGLDIFDGFVLDSSVLAGERRFVEAELVEEIFERGTLLKCERAAVEALPPPGHEPGS